MPGRGEGLLQHRQHMVVRLGVAPVQQRNLLRLSRLAPFSPVEFAAASAPFTASAGATGGALALMTAGCCTCRCSSTADFTWSIISPK